MNTTTARTALSPLPQMLLAAALAALASSATAGKPQPSAAAGPRLEANLPKGFPAPGPVGKVVLKDYPPARAARAAGEAFRPLLKHIKDNAIAMTTPVEYGLAPFGTDAALAVRSTAFYYPSRSAGKPGGHGRVDVTNIPPQRVLSIALTGRLNLAALMKARSRLDAELNQRDGLEPAGSYRLLAYHSPFVPAGKRWHELQLPVRAPAATTAPATADGESPETRTAVFAGGCFWCVEAVFEQLDGVLSAVSGYAGGTKETANYKAVCTGKTGHAEAVRITYDPKRISYRRLLEVLFTVAHDPTQKNRQGPDVGPQYRSAVFYADEAQKRAALTFVKRLEARGAFGGRRIVTTFEPLKGFYPAEAYHQDYARCNPGSAYVERNVRPKFEKLFKAATPPAPTPRTTKPR